MFFKICFRRELLNWDFRVAFLCGIHKFLPGIILVKGIESDFFDFTPVCLIDSAVVPHDFDLVFCSPIDDIELRKDAESEIHKLSPASAVCTGFGEFFQHAVDIKGNINQFCRCMFFLNIIIKFSGIIILIVKILRGEDVRHTDLLETISICSFQDFLKDLPILPGLCLKECPDPGAFFEQFLIHDRIPPVCFSRSSLYRSYIPLESCFDTTDRTSFTRSGSIGTSLSEKRWTSCTVAVFGFLSSPTGTRTLFPVDRCMSSGT